eukprot:4752862-Pleurochrysis_carterae.AAC.4
MDIKVSMARGAQGASKWRHSGDKASVPLLFANIPRVCSRCSRLRILWTSLFHSVSLIYCVEVVEQVSRPSLGNCWLVE